MSPVFQLLKLLKANAPAEKCVGPLQTFCRARYDIFVTIGECARLLADVRLARHVSLESCAMLETHLRRGIEKLDSPQLKTSDPQPVPRLVYNRLTMGWGGDAFEDAGPVDPKPARSKVFRQMARQEVTPIDFLSSLVAGTATRAWQQSSSSVETTKATA